MRNQQVIGFTCMFQVHFGPFESSMGNLGSTYRGNLQKVNSLRWALIQWKRELEHSTHRRKMQAEVKMTNQITNQHQILSSATRNKRRGREDFTHNLPEVPALLYLALDFHSPEVCDLFHPLRFPAYLWLPTNL